jgi:hypothetical protein
LRLLLREDTADQGSVWVAGKKKIKKNKKKKET